MVIELSPSFSKMEFDSFRGKIVWTVGSEGVQRLCFCPGLELKHNEFVISTHLVRNRKDFGLHNLFL